MTSDPRDLPAEYLFYHYSSDQRVVACIRCGAQSAVPSAGDLATAKVQPLWGGFPVRGTRQAMENWASVHELRCPKRSQAQLDALRRTEPAYVPVRVASAMQALRAGKLTLDA